MEVIKEKLWLENNRLSDTRLYYIKTLAKRKKLKVQETVHRGYKALLLTSGLETYKAVLNTDKFKLNVLGKNRVGSEKEYFHHIKDFEGETDAWFEAVQFIGELIRSKRGEYICLGKRYYRKQAEYG